MESASNQEFDLVFKTEYTSLSNAACARFFLAVVKYDCKITSLWCMHKRWRKPEFIYEPRYTGVEFILKIPIHFVDMFEKDTGLKLEEPRKVNLN